MKISSILRVGRVCFVLHFTFHIEASSAALLKSQVVVMRVRAASSGTRRPLLR